MWVGWSFTATVLKMKTEKKTASLVCVMIVIRIKVSKLILNLQYTDADWKLRQVKC